MRTISRSSRFKRDYKKLLSGVYGRSVESDLIALLHLLATDQALPEVYRDHPLAGEWHAIVTAICGRMLFLSTARRSKCTLQLVRIGSHSDLF
jgi:mRNA interferase YafQ